MNAAPGAQSSAMSQHCCIGQMKLLACSILSVSKRSMKPISKEALAYLKERMPELVVRVDASAQSQARNMRVRLIRISLGDFAEDPFLLYSAVWYICSLGLRATVSA